MPRYNAEKARAAGVPEPEIRARLAKASASAGLTVRDMLRATADAPIGNGGFTTRGAAKSLAGTARMAGPMAGGMVGGIPGATIGGGAGEAVAQGLESLIGEGPQNGTELRRDIENAAAFGGATELLPASVSKAAPFVAKKLAAVGLKVPAALRRNFPTVDFEKVFLREKIPVSRGSTTGNGLPNSTATGGEAVAEARRIASAQEQNAMIDAAHAGGLSGYTPREVASGPATSRTLRTLRRGTAPVTDRAQVRSLVNDEFMAANPANVWRGQNANGVQGRIKMANVLTPQHVQDARQAAGAVAFARPDRAGAGAMARGATESNWKLYNEALWENATNLLERDIPDFAAQNAKTQELMALEQALGMREMPSTSGGLLHAASIASHPNLVSRAALKADSPFLQAMLGRAPQAAILGAGQAVSANAPQGWYNE